MAFPKAALIYIGLGLALLLSGMAAPAPYGSRTCLGIHGSPFGKLLSRLLKSSLGDFWHSSGSTETLPKRSFEKRLGSKEEKSFSAPAKDQSYFWTMLLTELQDLEAERHRRSSAFDISTTQKKQLEAAGNERLKLAFQLDPGDYELYEMLHITLASEPGLSASGKTSAVRAIAEMSINNAHLHFSGLFDQLAAIGAAQNCLLDLFSLPPSSAHQEEIRHFMQVQDDNLLKLRLLMRNSEHEEWWKNLPLHRKVTLNNYASMLEKLALNLKAKEKILNQASPH